MLKPDKIRMMADLAIYEKNNKKNVFDISNFYENDYIAGQLFAGFVRFTICAILMVSFYILLHSEYVFTKINLDGVSAIFRKTGLYYVAGLVIYLIITYFVSKSRYRDARKGMLLYASKLKRLGRKYNDISKNKGKEQ